MATYLSDKEHYAQLLPDNRTLCFDVGANIGRVSEVLLELGHKVVAFEPQPECVREIKARCEPWKQNLHIENTALGEADGEANLFVRESSGQSSLKQTWEGQITGVMHVPLSTLDRAIDRFGMPQYCKIDVEGSELEVLRGLSRPIPLISFEYHQRDGKMKDAYACLDRLSSLGKIKVNLTPREQSRLVLDEWKDAAEFRTTFQAKFEGKEDFLFGDLYVKVQ
jgi:FkbM family methyltransferase